MGKPQPQPPEAGPLAPATEGRAIQTPGGRSWQLDGELVMMAVWNEKGVPAIGVAETPVFRVPDDAPTSEPARRPVALGGVRAVVPILYALRRPGKAVPSNVRERFPGPAKAAGANQ